MATANTINCTEQQLEVKAKLNTQCYCFVTPDSFTQKVDVFSSVQTHFTFAQQHADQNKHYPGRDASSSYTSHIRRRRKSMDKDKQISTCAWYLSYSHTHPH